MANDEKELALKYSWKWFKYHAQQRYQAFNIFLLVMGALAYGYAQAGSNTHLKFAIGVLGFVVSFSFMFIEKRSNTLVNYGRAALKELNSNNVIKTILEKDKKDANCFLSHKFWFRVVIMTSLVASYLAMLDSLHYFDGIRKHIPVCLFNCGLWVIPGVFIVVAFILGLRKCREGE